MTSSRKMIARQLAQPPFFVGVDLGGTNTKVGVVDDLGQTLSYLTIPTARSEGAEVRAQRMSAAVNKAIEQATLQPTDVARIGLGAPGPIDIATGMMLNPVNMPSWHSFPVRDRLISQCGLPVTFANDASAAAFGEYWLGASDRQNSLPIYSLVMLTLGTGIGGGIVVAGKSIDGQHSHGAECGHLVIDYHDNARVCSCGQTGHLEAYASGTSVVKRTLEALEEGMKTSLDARMEHGLELTPKLIGEEAAAGDPLAVEIVMDTAFYVAIGIVTLMHTIDPDAVLLGGAMDFGGRNSPLGRQFLTRIREEVQRRAFPIPAQQTTIDYAALGPDAGYLGAAGLARAEHLHSAGV